MFQCQVKWDLVFVPCLSKCVHWWWHFQSYGIRQGLDSHPTFTWPAELKQISTRKSVTCSPSFHLTPFKNCQEPRGWRATGFWVPPSSAAVNRSFRSSGVEPVTKGQGGVGVGDLRAWQLLPLAFSWGTLASNHSRVLCLWGPFPPHPLSPRLDLRVHSVSSDVPGPSPFLLLLRRTELRAALSPDPGSTCVLSRGVLEHARAPQLTLGVPCFLWGSNASFRIPHSFQSKEKLHF